MKRTTCMSMTRKTLRASKLHAGLAWFGGSRRVEGGQVDSFLAYELYLCRDSVQ